MAGEHENIVADEIEAFSERYAEAPGEEDGIVYSTSDRQLGDDDAGGNEEIEDDRASVEVAVDDDDSYQRFYDSDSSSDEEIEFEDVDLEEIESLETWFSVDGEGSSLNDSQHSPVSASDDEAGSLQTDDDIPDLVLGTHATSNDQIDRDYRGPPGFPPGFHLPFPRMITVSWADAFEDGQLRINGRIVRRSYAQETQAESKSLCHHSKHMSQRNTSSPTHTV